MLLRALKALALALALAAGSCHSAAPVAPAAPAPPLLVQDAAGRAVAPLEAPGARAIVLVFVLSDCPISNAFAPEIERIRAAYEPRGVVFDLVYPDPDETAEKARAHAADFGHGSRVLLDPEHVLVARAGATISPEAAVFSPAGELLYRGRIDDRFADFMKQRPAPTARDLRAALDAVLAGKRPEPARTTAIGCFLPEKRAAVPPAPPPTAAAPGAAASEPLAPGRARIVYDGFRIPHVFAGDDAALFFALGYLEVRDFPVATLANLWSASGRFAEVAGPSVLARDRRVRQFGIDERARAQALDPELLDPSVKPLLEAFVDGVNAGRAWWLADRARLDALAGPSGQELWFDPVPPFLDPVLVAEDHRARLERLVSAEVALEHVLALGVALNGGPEFMGAGYSLFTNVWTARNAADASDVFMLVDSHQPIQRAGARGTFVQLSGPGYEAAGYTMPGYPCVVLGFNPELAFSITTLPQPPRRIVEAGLPFRYRGEAPVTRAAWSLAPGETIALQERYATLRSWDVARGALVDDPAGQLVFRRVPADELGPRAPGYPVTDPPPGPATEAFDPSRALRFEGRSFLFARSPWEFWIRVARARRVGGGADGVERVLDEAAISFGRGELFDAVDVAGGLEHAWTSRVPRGAAPGAGLLDGADPAARWRGFLGLAEVPRLLDTGGFGARPEAWIDCNVSPHFVRPAGGFAGDGLSPAVFEPEPWKSWRQDRARELLERAAQDGRLELGELERAALDVQDPWARALWPLVRALAGDGTDASDGARELARWIDAHRHDGPDGAPGPEEFLATSGSEVAVWLALLRGFYEDGLLAPPGASASELALGFDPCATIPDARAFLGEERWARERTALLAALEQTARLRAGGFGNRALLGGAGGGAASVAGLTWGEVHFLGLTPHQRRLAAGKGFDDALRSILRPAEVSAATPFHRAQQARVLPMGGTEDSLFQLDAGSVGSIAQALHPTPDGLLFLEPVDFGSQIAWVVRLARGERPRMRFLALLGSTEVTRAIPGSAIADGDHFATTEAFARGAWSELVLERAALERAPRAVLELELAHAAGTGRLELTASAR